ncbi:MAG TPA: cupin domain-containing protein [Bacillota bacterium]
MDLPTDAPADTTSRAAAGATSATDAETTSTTDTKTTSTTTARTTAPAAAGTPTGTPVDDLLTHLAQLGSGIRTLRHNQGLTLGELSERTGISVSMLSMVERGQANPTVGTLIAVASALGVEMTDLFGPAGREGASPVTRRDEQPIVHAATGFTRRVLVHDRTRGIEMVLNSYEPGAHSDVREHRHRGYEFGFVLTGELQVELAGTVHRLSEGDSIAYASTVPHRLQNPGTGRTVTIWVNLWSL